MCAHRLTATNLPPLAPIRRLHSLSRTDIETVTTELGRSSPGWTVDQHDDCHGDILLILTPPGSDESPASFILSRALSGIQLARAHDDSFEPIGSFTTIAAAIQCVVEGENRICAPECIGNSGARRD